MTWKRILSSALWCSLCDRRGGLVIAFSGLSRGTRNTFEIPRRGSKCGYQRPIIYDRDIYLGLIISRPTLGIFRDRTKFTMGRSDKLSAHQRHAHRIEVI